jgi:transposase
LAARAVIVLDPRSRPRDAAPVAYQKRGVGHPGSVDEQHCRAPSLVLVRCDSERDSAETPPFTRGCRANTAVERRFSSGALQAIRAWLRTSSAAIEISACCCRICDWLDEDHLAWFVIEAIEELDRGPFYAAYSADGHGRAAHDPKMMLTPFAYAYCVGERSSRGIERRCREDVAFRVVCANRVPDHATVDRFRVRHHEALAGPFGRVLGLRARAGLVRIGVMASTGRSSEPRPPTRRSAPTRRSRPRFWPRRPRSTPPRASASARHGATSCPSI